MINKKYHKLAFITIIIISILTISCSKSKETIKIGTLAGWDSDNPTATWGGLLGFILGKEGVEKKFGRSFANKFNIHRTRQNFPNNGIDSFERMAQEGIFIVDRVVQEELKGSIDLDLNVWHIPEN